MDRRAHPESSAKLRLGLFASTVIVIAAAAALSSHAPVHAAQSGAPAAQAAPKPAPANDPADRHSITVSFDYDFTKNPSCAEKPKLKSCISQFVVYDVSGPQIKLFTIPVPDGAHGLVKGITGKSPEKTFLPGQHLIAVTALAADGSESPAGADRVSLNIQRKLTGSGSPARSQ